MTISISETDFANAVPGTYTGLLNYTGMVTSMDAGGETEAGKGTISLVLEVPGVEIIPGTGTEGPAPGAPESTEPTPVQTAAPAAEEIRSPKTGSESLAGFWALLSALSMAGLAFAAIRFAKERSTGNSV